MQCADAGQEEVLGGETEIVSAVVSALPGQRERLRAAMLGLPGVEIHGETRDGRFVVTIGRPWASAGDRSSPLHRLEDVLAAALVSH